MNYLALRTQFAWQGVVSVAEILRAFPHFDRRRLVEWQQRGYVQRVVNRWYHFTEVPVEEHLLWWTANRIYQPAYLSLETALSYHGLIPEGVYSLTSVTTRKTQIYTTPLGHFSYQQLKPALYFGYEVLRPAGRPILMANMEKALLDYCYLHPHLTTAADFEALRLNADVLLARLDRRRLATYQALFHHTRLNQRIRVLLATVATHA